MELIRYKGVWYKITPKPYEPEHRSRSIAWAVIRDKITPEEATKLHFEIVRNDYKVLFPIFRKDG